MALVKASLFSKENRLSAQLQKPKEEVWRQSLPAHAFKAFASAASDIIKKIVIQ